MKNLNPLFNTPEMQDLARDVDAGEIRDNAEMREGCERDGFFQGSERE